MSLALVMFLSQLPVDPASRIEDVCLEGLGQPCEVDGDSWRFRSGEEAYRVTLAVHPHPDGVDLATRLEDPVEHEAFTAHVGTLTVEWIVRDQVPEFAAAYQPIAHFVAAACDATTVALHAPQWDRLLMVDSETPDLLRGPQPLLGFGIVHTQLGCLLREGSMWLSVFPSRWGVVQITAAGGPNGPRPEHTNRMRDIAEYRLRALRSRLLFSLLYRPCQVMLDDQGEISVEYRNWLTGTRSHFVSENDVPFPRGGSATMG